VQRDTLDRVVPEINARTVVVDENIAKVSLVGTGMKSAPGVAAAPSIRLAKRPQHLGHFRHRQSVCPWLLMPVRQPRL
jgi:aspartokinase